METNMKTFIQMLNDDSGAAAAEYALILAIIGSGLALAAYNLGTKISAAMDKAGNCVTTQSANALTAC
jgi:pilus assembly protein Flp/PilA